MNVLRGLLFNLFYSTSVLLFSILATLIMPFLSFQERQRLLRMWPLVVMILLRVICGIRFQVEGKENIPNSPVVIVSNHQSSWETIALFDLLWPICTVLKKELTYIPFFGWALSWAEPIVIDRSKKATALKEILRQGKKRLSGELSVLIFPEGTRVPPNETRPYMPGAALLAIKSGVPLLPVAHNAGCHWPAHQIKKIPGVIKVKIGEPLDTQSADPKQLTKQVESWISNEKNLLASK